MGALRAKSASTSAVAPRSLPSLPLSRPTLVGASGRRMLACRAQAAPNKPNQPQPRDQVKARCVPEGDRACAMRCSSGDVGASRLAARLPPLDAMRFGPSAPTSHQSTHRCRTPLPCACRAVDVSISSPTSTSVVGDAVNAVKDAIAWAEMSYNKQYDKLFSEPLDTKKPVPKPDKAAQALEPGSKKVLLSDVHAVTRRPLLNRKWSTIDMAYAAFIGGMHVVAAFAPMTFSWNMVGLFFVMYFISGCLGITLSYHRQLSHRSFTTPKWVEYVLAYCGVLAAQGDPIEVRLPMGGILGSRNREQPQPPMALMAHRSRSGAAGA